MQRLSHSSHVLFLKICCAFAAASVTVMLLTGRPASFDRATAVLLVFYFVLGICLIYYGVSVGLVQRLVGQFRLGLPNLRYGWAGLTAVMSLVLVAAGLWSSSLSRLTTGIGIAMLAYVCYRCRGLPVGPKLDHVSTTVTVGAVFLVFVGAAWGFLSG